MGGVTPMDEPTVPTLTREETLRREMRSRVIAWALVGLVLLFFLGTGIRLGGATPSLTTLLTGTLLIVGALMPGLIFTLPLMVARVIAVLMAAGALFVWLSPSQPLPMKVVSAILVLIVLVQMVVRGRAARRGAVGDQ
jgi:hypothetical protein